MIHAVLVDKQTLAVTQGGSELIETWRADANSVLWLDICGEAPADEQALLEDFSVHPLAIQDALRKRHPPKIERFDDFVFILLRGLDSSKEIEGLQFSVIQLALFVGEDWIITRHQKPSTSVNRYLQKITEGMGEDAADPLGIALAIMNRLVRRYVEMLLDFEPRLEEIEQEMFERPNDILLAELTNQKSRLREINRIARYHLLVVSDLQDQQQAHSGDYVHEAIDLAEQVDRTASLCSLYYDTSKDLTDGYLALTSHNLNRVMQVLTVITVIFVPLTFIAGIYGMNFEYMPELSVHEGYFFVLGFMVVIGVSLFAFFKRRHWV